MKPEVVTTVDGVWLIYRGEQPILTTYAPVDSQPITIGWPGLVADSWFHSTMATALTQLRHYEHSFAWSLRLSSYGCDKVVRGATLASMDQGPDLIRQMLAEEQFNRSREFPSFLRLELFQSRRGEGQAQLALWGRTDVVDAQDALRIRHGSVGISVAIGKLGQLENAIAESIAQTHIGPLDVTTARDILRDILRALEPPQKAVA